MFEIDAELEMIVLGQIMQYGLEKYNFLDENCFNLAESKKIFLALKERDSQGESYNYEMIAPKSKLLGLDFQWVSQCYSKASGLTSNLEFARDLKEFSNKVKIANIANQVLEEVKTMTTTDLIESIYARLSEVGSTTSGYKTISFKQSLERVLEQKQNPVKYTSTGLARLDEAMAGGLERGKFYCFSARPKAGKTMTKGTIANNLRKDGKVFVFVAAEMGSTEITKRLICSDYESQVKDIFYRDVVDLYAKNYKITQENMFYIDEPRIKLETLISAIRSQVRSKGIEGFILDYLQLVAGRDDKTSQVEHLEHVAQSIAELCSKENIWCISSCQMNRQGELRGSDGALMAANWVYEIRRVGDEKKNKEEDEENELRSEIWLRCMGGRDSKAINIGSKSRPAFKISSNGTHLIELPR